MAIPAVFANDADISTQSVWVIDGPHGERTVWQRLFKSIKELL